MTLQTPETIARDYLDGQKAHDRLDAWLKGSAIDAAHKAMNISAVAKKPGRVVKRVGKALSDLFETPQVVQWTKEMKVVYATSYTRGDLRSVLRQSASQDLPAAPAIFQTDLYFRANADVTEINASTISAISEPAMRALVEAGDFNHEDGGMAIKKAMTRGRILQTGLESSGLAPDKVHQMLVPQGDFALVALIMPIDRIEFDEEKTGQVVTIVGILKREDLSPAEVTDLDEMAHAMTREGHPGAEAFGAMIAARATAVDPIRFTK